jgi:hypothetical protein
LQQSPPSLLRCSVCSAAKGTARRALRATDANARN